MGDGRGSRCFCGTRTNPGGYGKNRRESGVGYRLNPLAAGTAIDCGDESGNTSDESPRMNKKVTRQAWPLVRKSQKSAEVKGAHPRQYVQCGVLAHPSRYPGSAKRECVARRPL